MVSPGVPSATKLTFESYLQRSTPLATKTHFQHLQSTHFHLLDHGHALLHHHNGFVNFLHLLYPIFKFNFLDAQKVPANYWAVAFNRRHFLELLAGKKGFVAYAHWKALNDKEIRGEHGRALFAKNNTILSILEDNYAEYNWTRTDRWPTALEPARKRLYMDYFLAAHYPHISRLPHLASIDNLSFIQHGGGTALNHSSGSLTKALQGTYPELYPETHPALLAYSGNERAIVDRFVLESERKVERQADLSAINIALFSSTPQGGTLLSLNGGSLQSVFGLAYPELVVRYRCERRGYWSNLEGNVGALLEIVRVYEVRGMKDWGRVSVEQFSEVYGKGVRKEKVMRLLEYWLPEEEWDRVKFSEGNKRAKQRVLGLRLKEILKDEVIFEEYAVKLEDGVHIFDFYVPRLKLVIEYQGEQHYYSVVTWISLEGRKQRDEEKVKICERDGLKLVHVPYWWDTSLEGLTKIFSALNISIK